MDAIVIGCDEAWAMGFDSYGVNDTCPFTYEDLKHEWRSGWFHALAAFAAYPTAKENVSIWN